MIPKIIHYCWFGRGKLPELAEKCIASWKEVLPEYDIKEWNEDNFDLDLYPYTREAYNAKKYAFVTDVVRLYALYTEGGIYMDTDVEILKPMDRFLHHEAFSGFESNGNIPTGLMASEKGSTWAKEMLRYYDNNHFLRQDNSFDMTTNVVIITNLMKPYGFKATNQYQELEHFTLYPSNFFCPKDPETGVIHLTEETYCIHHFNGSWYSPKDKALSRIKKVLMRLIGRERVRKIIETFNLRKLKDH